MKRKNCKDIIIKVIKDLAGVICVGVCFFSILLMFCQPSKVIDMIFCREVIGLLGLLVGGIIGFMFGAVLTYKHFANEISILEQALDKKIMQIRKLSNDNLIAESFIKNFASKQQNQPTTSNQERIDKFFNEINGQHTASYETIPQETPQENDEPLQEDSPIEET